MKRFFILCIRLYQKSKNPLTNGSCRFTPPCSQYALQAIERHGAFFGGILAVWRLLRCNPFAKGGYDPVPERLFFQKK